MKPCGKVDCSMNNDIGGLGRSTMPGEVEGGVSRVELGPLYHSPPSVLSGRRVQRSPL